MLMGIHVLEPVTLRIYDSCKTRLGWKPVGLWQGAALILKLSLQVLLLQFKVE